MQYTIRIVALFLFLLAALGLLVHGCISIGSADDAQRARDVQQWREFSAAHHCRVKPAASVFAPTVWACDGFDVRHDQ